MAYIPNKSAESANITLFEVVSNYGKTISLDGGVITLNYFESILDNTVRVVATIMDTGNRYGSTDGKSVFEDSDLKLTVGEKVYLSFEDNNGTTVRFTERNPLIIREVRNVTEDTRKTFFTLELWSEESTYNNLVETRVVQSYSGKISETVNRILKENLKTQKTCNIEQTLNTLFLVGNIEKPFYVCVDLASKSVPTIANSKNTLAGFFFYETAEGYQFRSIDSLLKQNQKRTLIYNDSTGVPAGYDGKIITYSFDSTYNLEKILLTGSFTNSKMRVLDPVTENYEETTFNYSDQYKGQTNLGLEFPTIDANWKFKDSSSKIYSAIQDKGSFMDGSTASQQLQNSQEINFEAEEIVRQSRSRYNQLFSTKLTITIAGDIKLRAGDLVFCDLPETTSNKLKSVSQTKSGLYMISDVCHRLSPDSTWTKLNLVRDSLGRKPF